MGRIFVFLMKNTVLQMLKFKLPPKRLHHKFFSYFYLNKYANNTVRA